MTAAKQKVLIVEDEMIVQMHLEGIVSGLGHHVVGTAATTEEALAAADADAPDLVLMDIHLADGCDGVQTAAALRERHDCAVVFVTAYADEATIQRTSETVPAGYVVKPFTGADVRAAISTALVGHSTLRAARQAARDEQHRADDLARRSRGIRQVDLGVAGPRRPFGQDTRLLVYSHDTLGLGHLRRSTALIRQLTEDHPGLSTLLVSGSPMVHRYPLPPRTDYVKLPAVRKEGPQDYQARSLGMSGQGIQSMRSNLLLRTVQDYDPDVILVDHSPLGMGGELVPSLEWLGETGRCLRVLGLRDVIDSPERVAKLWGDDGVLEKIDRFYEHVVVYGSAEIYDTVREYAFPEGLAARCHPVGYVCGRRADDRDGGADAPGASPAPQADELGTPVDGPGARPRVVVAIGGGDGGVDTVLHPFLDMLRGWEGPVPFDTEFLPGPLLPEADADELVRRSHGLPVTIQHFVPSSADRFARADLVVSTAGYNSSTEILGYARRALFVPRIMHREEQLVRAARLEELGLAQMIHPEQVTPSRLAREVQAALAAPPVLAEARAAGRVPLDGAAQLSAFLATLEVGSRGS